MSNQLTRPVGEPIEECSAAQLREQRERFLRKLADIARKAQKKPRSQWVNVPMSQCANVPMSQRTKDR